MRNTADKWSLCSLTGLVASYLMLLFCSSATSQGAREVSAARFEFALIGDMPYDGRQEKEFANLMREIDAAELAFVVHDGDFWYDGLAWTEQLGGLPPCGDETFKHRLGLAQSSKHPFIFVAGDNEWADCHRAKPRTYEPLERLAKLRQMFFHGDHSLGQRTIRLTRQSEDSRYANFRENMRWTQNDVMFVTLHIIGSNNNLGRTPEMDAEYSERNAANLAWMRQAFDLATRSGSRAIMIIAQAASASPWSTCTEILTSFASTNRCSAPQVDGLSKISREWRPLVILIHIGSGQSLIPMNRMYLTSG
jgi:hypothetical protein